MLILILMQTLNLIPILDLILILLIIVISDSDLLGFLRIFAIQIQFDRPNTLPDQFTPPTQVCTQRGRERTLSLPFSYATRVSNSLPFRVQLTEYQPTTLHYLEVGIFKIICRCNTNHYTQKKCPGEAK